MVAKTYLIFPLFLFLVSCTAVGEASVATPHAAGPSPNEIEAVVPAATVVHGTPIELPTTVFPLLSETSTPTASPTSTLTLTPTATELAFEVGEELTIAYLRSLLSQNMHVQGIYDGEIYVVKEK